MIHLIPVKYDETLKISSFQIVNSPPLWLVNSGHNTCFTLGSFQIFYINKLSHELSLVSVSPSQVRSCLSTSVLSLGNLDGLPNPLTFQAKKFIMNTLTPDIIPGFNFKIFFWISLMHLPHFYH